MKFLCAILTFAAFLGADFSAHALTSYDEGSAASCWTCEYVRGESSWTTRAGTQAQAKTIAQKECRKSSGVKNCAFKGCWKSPQYGVKSCKVSTSKYTAAEYAEPTYPQQNRCSSNNDCSGLDVCVRGECKWKGAASNTCSANSDCGWPSECVRGKCGSPGADGCDSNIDCPGFDICVSGKCVSDNSYDNRCSSTSDCSFPQSCIADKCQ